jgi:hypothetical protein
MTTTAKTPPHESRWQGSLKTVQLVRAQIAERWGEAEAEKYDPETNCFTYNTWKAKGYHVKKGEKALRSFTLVTKFGEADENGTAQDGGVRFPKGVCLFYYLQVEKQEAKA